ncbi:MAG: hypothetical protein WD423_04905 [Rhodothermales bacterium]
MRALYTQFSGLAGLLAFLNQLWTYAPLERTILIGFGTGLGVYLLLILGDVTINRILAQTPPALADKPAGSANGSTGNDDSGANEQEQREAKAA